jgi:predicted phosphodiesterase
MATENTSKLEQFLKRHHLNEVEALDVLRSAHDNKPVKTFRHDYGGKHAKFMVISDTHIGSKYFNHRKFDEAVKIAKKESVDAVYHAGDVIEGMSNRPGHIYEIETLGVSAQVEQAADLLKQFNKPLYFTTGNHCEWSKNKADQGFLVGPALEDKIPKSEFLGEYNARVRLGDHVVMGLSHEGSSAYALSYSGQKRINALEGGSKPNILFNGHIHKMMYMFYRNIHYFEAGCFQNQTPFMAMKGAPAMVGYWVIDMSMGRKGINQLKQTAYPGY